MISVIKVTSAIKTKTLRKLIILISILKKLVPFVDNFKVVMRIEY